VLSGLFGIIVLAEVRDDDVGAFTGNAMAAARPIPLSAPVITVALPVSFPQPT
jgi:hypothetical protein